MECLILSRSKQFNLLKARLTLGVLIFACINFRNKKKKKQVEKKTFREYFSRSISLKHIFLHLFETLRLLKPCKNNLKIILQNLI